MSIYYLTNLVTDTYSSCHESVIQLKSRLLFEFTGMPLIKNNFSNRVIELNFSPCQFNMPEGIYNIKDSTIDYVELYTKKKDVITASIHLAHYTRYNIKTTPGLPFRVYLYVDRSPLISLFKNRLIYLDPGCNSKAVSPTSLKEEQTTYLIAKQLCTLLDLMQSNVSITREKPVNIKMRMQMLLKKPPGILIAIGTTVDNPKVSGFKVHYHPPSKESLELATCIHDAMKEKLPLDSLGIHPTNYSMLSLGNPGVLVEAGCIKNRVDEGHLRDVDYRQKVAQAIYNGLKKYFELIH